LPTWASAKDTTVPAAPDGGFTVVVEDDPPDFFFWDDDEDDGEDEGATTGARRVSVSRAPGAERVVSCSVRYALSARS
jgi:hypothetical protein